MDRFTGFTIPDIQQAAYTRARYRLSTLEVIRHADKDERRLFLSEFRGTGRKPFTETHLLMQLFSHFEPIAAKQRPNIKDPAFEEIALPRKLSSYTSDLRVVGGFLKPHQPMVNFVSRALPLGSPMYPSIRPTLCRI